MRRSLFSDGVIHGSVFATTSVRLFPSHGISGGRIGWLAASENFDVVVFECSACAAGEFRARDVVTITAAAAKKSVANFTAPILGGAASVEKAFSERGES